VAGSCECGNESSGYVPYWEILEYMSNGRQAIQDLNFMDLVQSAYDVYFQTSLRETTKYLREDIPF
jgi:hypothetical protein